MPKEILSRSLPTLLLPALALAATSCTEPDQFLPPNQSGGPAGALSGALTYSGPLPCTEQGYVVGAAVLLVFDTRLLPPPEGLGTTAASLATVGGETLFAGVRDRLTFNADGSRWCPASTVPPVTVTADWSDSPLPGAEYEVRGFYDYDGNFDPVFSITHLPSKGDIAGGAIDNVSDVLQKGAAPQYRRIALGAEQPDGTFKIPDDGSHIGGIAVTLALPLPNQLPIFYSKSVLSSSNTCKNGAVVPATTKQTDPNHVVMPQDYTLPIFTQTMPDQTEDSLIRFELGAGVAPSEIDLAAASPFNLPVKDPAPTFNFSWQDVNGDGMFDIGGDHIPDSGLIPSLFPVSIFSKLDDDATLSAAQHELQAQAKPVVIIQGLTIYQNILETATFTPGNSAYDTKVFVGVRPAVLCLDPTTNSNAKLVITHKNDCMNNPILTMQAQTQLALKKQFNRDVDIVEACLPKGRYALNLVYGTGQAWSVPNEAGVCQKGEDLDPKDTTQCKASAGSRPRLASQDVYLTIGEPDDAAYCQAHPPPAECLPPTSK
jgi:hypothetical protein